MQEEKVHIKNLPLKTMRWEELLIPLHLANTALGRMDALMRLLVSSEVLLDPFYKYQNVIPSEILDYVYEPQETMEEGHTRSNPHEIDIYTRALLKGKSLIDSGEIINEDFFYKIHEFLLENSLRGKNRAPGQIRTKVSHMKCFVTFNDEEIEGRIKLLGPKAIKTKLQNFFEFIHDSNIEPLLRSAFFMGQFLAIHPFRDGNGRLIRTLVPLFLYEKKLISQPYLDIQAGIERNRVEYLLFLQSYCVSAEHHNWIVFFLKVVWEQANIQIEKILKILKMYQKKSNEFRDIFGEKGEVILNSFFSQAIWSEDDLQKKLTGISSSELQNMIAVLIEKNVIFDIYDNGQRYFVMPDLVNIIAGKDVFVFE